MVPTEKVPKINAYQIYIDQNSNRIQKEVIQKNADLLTIPFSEVIKGCVDVVLGGLPGFLLKTCSGADVATSIVFGS